MTGPELVDVLATSSSGRRRRRERVPRWVRRLSGPVLLVAVWWIGTATGVIDTDLLPGPDAVVDTGWEMVESGELFRNLWASLQRVLLGLLIGIVTGGALALAAGLFRLGEDVLDSGMQVLRAIPVVALTPLFILWFGLGEEPKVAIIALATTFPIYLNTFSAIRGVDEGLIEMAEVFGVGRLGLVRRVVMPAALPGFLIGLRYSLAVTWLVLIFAEQINTLDGLGYLLNQSLILFQTDMMVVVIVVYGILGFASDAFVRLLEGRLLTWRRGFAGT